MSRYIDIEPYEKDGWYLQKHYHNSYGEVIKTTPLASVPTAETEPKHAYVMVDEDGNMECSNCGSSNCFDNYCGTCGAKLVGERKESDIYCDRNLCVQNEYNGIGCDECQKMRKDEVEE